ncbi:MAG: NEW3 domain-containing protein, partial [Thermofilaceae archaeon]
YYGVKHCLTVNFDVKHRNWRIVEFKFPEVAAYPGSIFKIPLRVFNPLEEVCTVDLSITAPSSWTAWFEVNSQYVNALTLDPGSFMWLNLTVRVPENAAAGNYTVTVEGRSLDALSKAALQVRIESRYDTISMEVVAPIVDAEPGNSAVIPLTIRNDGTGASLVTFYAVGLPVGYLWHLKDEQGNIISALRLSPRSSQRMMLFVEIPGTAPPTAIGFIFRAVGLNSSTSIELGINVKGKATVEIEATNWEIETMHGAPARFTLIVRNNGQIPVNDLTIQVGGTSPEGLHVDVIPSIVENLPPGSSTSFTVTVIPEERAAYGRYYIPLVIVGKGVREERILVVNIRVGSQLFYLTVSIAIIVLAVFTLIRQLKRRGS